MPVTIEATDLGPLARAKVQLAPLTVFIGPNNTGKSVAAMLTYAAMLSTPDRDFISPGRRNRYLRRAGAGRASFRYVHQHEPEDLDEAALDVLEAAARKRRLTDADIPEPLLQTMTDALSGLLADSGLLLCRELERCFGTRLHDLTRTPPTRGASATITLSSSHPRWAIEVSLRRSEPKIGVLRLPSPSALLRIARDQGAPIFDLDHPYEFRLGYLATHLLEVMFQACFVGFPSVPYYLPAARSGILQSHKALASFVMRRAPLAGIEEMNIPRMSGVITDFIGLLLNIDAHRSGSFAYVADYLEASMLEGEIRMDARPQTYPEISYVAGRHQLPLHRTSSMVSEMAPVVLYLRYLLDTGELFIIEEPESHLHPASQLRLAKAITMLVNGGMQVLLTTHSDFFLQQLSNMIMAGALEDAALASEDPPAVDESPTLRADQVRAYLYQPRPSGGTVVEALTVSKTGGIDDAEFGRVTESLYDETVTLERRLLER